MSIPKRKPASYLPPDDEVGLRSPPDATELRAAAAASEGIEAAMACRPGRKVLEICNYIVTLKYILPILSSVFNVKYYILVLGKSKAK